MPSSTSNSEPPPGTGQLRARRDASWRACALTVVGVALGGLAADTLALVLSDPYDTGRFTPIHKPGVGRVSNGFGQASRGRNPNFDTALIGNSRSMLLEPARLSQLSGLKVVSLASPGVRPREQMATASYFIRHHPDGKALVFVLDEWWCNTDPKLPVRFPFPFWLYDESATGYVKGIVSPWSAMHLWRRSQYLLGLKPRSRPDGYADFTKGKVWTRERSRQLIAAEKPFQIDPRPPGGYPAVNPLRGVLAKRPPGMRVVFMFPPVYRSVLPQGASAAAFGQCKADLRPPAPRRRLAGPGGRRPAVAGSGRLVGPPALSQPHRPPDRGAARRADAAARRPRPRTAATRARAGPDRHCPRAPAPVRARA